MELKVIKSERNKTVSGLSAIETGKLSIIAPNLRCNLADDGVGGLVVVSAEAWACAYYFAYGYTIFNA